MALATQCPHCNTTFRVAQDQLKLRAGLVRCGSCKEIFNGIEHLLRPDSVAHTSPNVKQSEPSPAVTPVAKPVAEQIKPAAQTHPVEAEASGDIASEGIPISLLAKQPSAKAEPKQEPQLVPEAETASVQLDFAYPDPLPETEAEPEPEHRVEPRFASHFEPHAEPHFEAHLEPHFEPAAEHLHEPFIAPDAPSATSTEDVSEKELEQALEAHAAEAVEFVDYVEVARTHKKPVAEILDVEENKPQDPLQRMTLIDLSDADDPVDPYVEDVEDIREKTHEGETPAPKMASEAASETAAEAEQTQPVSEEPDPLDQVIDELKRKPLRSKKKPKPYKRLPTQESQSEPEVETDQDADPDPDPEEHDEPEFVKKSRRAQTVGRTLRIAMGIGSFFLLFGALGQASYTFRDQIAARMPETKPILVDACVLLNCKVGLPTQVDMISIESDQLETLGSNKDMSELSILLRNSSTIAQAWPNVEVTLNDGNNVMLSRRIYAPHDYLPANVDDKKGFAPNSEQPVKMRFDFTGIKPAGYHVGVFYP
jgi:predicted Zn finger-like uncharacterized protein